MFPGFDPFTGGPIKSKRPTADDIGLYLYQIRGEPITVSVLEGEFGISRREATAIMYHLIGDGDLFGYYFIRHACDGSKLKMVDQRPFLSGYAVPPWTCPVCKVTVQEGNLPYEMGGVVPENYRPRFNKDRKDV